MCVVITGGTKGIGRAIAKKFAVEGNNIAICARTSADLKFVENELKVLNPNIQVLSLKVDMQSKEEIAEFKNDMRNMWIDG